MPISIVVLASGSGSLMQALLDAPQANDIYQVRALVTDQPAAGAIGRAAKAGIEVVVLPLSDFATRDDWDQALAAAVEYLAPDLVVSAGFMRVIGQPLLSKFKNRIINTHPALLPNFPGAHAVRDALAANVAETGCTIHFVDAGVDTGPVIAQRAVPVVAADDEASLHEKIKIVERQLLIEVVCSLCAQLIQEGEKQ